jgi:hypothetical protein
MVKRDEVLAKLREAKAVCDALEQQLGDRGTLIVVALPADLLSRPFCVAQAANLEWLAPPAEVEDEFYSEMQRMSGQLWEGVPECQDPDRLLFCLDGVIGQSGKWLEQNRPLSTSVRTAPAASESSITREPSIAPFAALIRAIIRTRVDLVLFDLRGEIDAERVAACQAELLKVATAVIGKRLQLDCHVALKELSQASGALPDRADEILRHFEGALRAVLAHPGAMVSPEPSAPSVPLTISPPPGLA